MPRFGLATPKPWVSLGSEQEVEEEMTTEARSKVGNSFEICYRRFKYRFLIARTFEDSLSFEGRTW